MTRRPTELARLTYPELVSLQRDRPILILPVGSLEQHGPHLPLTTDIDIADGLARRLTAHRPLLVAPGFTYGANSQPRSGGGRHMPGSVGLPPSRLVPALSGIVSEYLRQGFHDLIVLNGHLENVAPIYEALEENLGVTGLWRHTAAKAVHINWWDFVTPDDLTAYLGSATVDWGAEHAGVLETSVLEALRPELVRTDRKARGGAATPVVYDAFPPRESTLWPNGIGSSAVEASAEIGEALVSKVVDTTEKVIIDEFGS